MHISFSHNISNLKNFYTKENIEEDIMLKGDLQLLNVFESMVILDHIYRDIRNNPAPENLQVTFSEFCVMSYLLQTISNNFSKLPDQYKKNKAFKEIAERIDESYAWQSSDRLSIAHTVNLTAFYNNNNSLILEHIRANFLDDKLFPLITDYCTNLFKEHELALVFPKITGEVDHFQGIEHISSNINKLKLPLNNARGQKPICKDDLYKLLCVNTILLNEIKENNKKLFDEKTFEAMVLVTLVNQAHANCLISLSNQADFTEDNLINNHLRPIRALRKDTAHTGDLKSVEYLDKYVWDQYEKFGELLLYNGGETRYRQIKELINTPIPTTKKEEIEKPVDISRAQTKNVATSTKRKEPMKKEQLFNEELLKYFKELPVSPSQISDPPMLDGKSISYKIMEILKEPYNSKQPISHENITKIKELMDYSNFNPNITIPVKYESPLLTLAEYAKTNETYDKLNKIDQIFSKSKKEFYTDPKFINHRPIDLLCQIANTEEELELIEQMIAKGANLVLRDQKDFGLVEHAIINNKTKALEIVLKNIPNDLLLQIMDGSILGSLEEGYGMKTRGTYPIFLAIALQKEDHATMLLSYDQQHDHRFEGIA